MGAGRAPSPRINDQGQRSPSLLPVTILTALLRPNEHSGTLPLLLQLLQLSTSWSPGPRRETSEMQPAVRPSWPVLKIKPPQLERTWWLHCMSLCIQPPAAPSEEHKAGRGEGCCSQRLALGLRRRAERGWCFPALGARLHGGERARTGAETDGARLTLSCHTCTSGAAGLMLAALPGLQMQPSPGCPLNAPL